MTPAHLTATIRERLRVEARDRCGYCQTQQSLAYASLEVDHIVFAVETRGHWVRAGWHPPRDERLGK